MPPPLQMISCLEDIPYRFWPPKRIKGPSKDERLGIAGLGSYVSFGAELEFLRTSLVRAA